MQAIIPVDVYVGNEPYEGSKVLKDVKTSNSHGRQALRIRTRAINSAKTNKTKPISSPLSHIPKQVVIPKVAVPNRSQSSSPNRGPWVPAPGRSTKGQKVSFQNPKSRLEINPVAEFIVDDEDSWNTERDKHNTTADSQSNTLSIEDKEKLMADIQVYEKRIQSVIDGIGILKELVHKRTNPEQTDQLRSDIDSSLHELERFQQNHSQHIVNPRSKPTRSRSLSPTHNKNRSSSVDPQPRRRSVTPKVSFQDDPINRRQRARSSTPIRGPLHLNPEREQLLATLSNSEADISQITKKLSSVTTLLKKLRLDDQPVSYEVEQLHQYRNELLHLIELFQHSNSKVQQYLRHQFHLEAEHGIIFDQFDTLKTHIHELEHENEQIRRLLLDRENDNIALLAELERIRSHSIGFDTMKTSLEQNRAHLQRELYTKEGEIHRLHCALRALERDLQRGRCSSDNANRSVKHKSIYSCPSPSRVTTKSKAITIERLQAELNDRDDLINELKTKLDDNSDSGTGDLKLENIRLKEKLEQTEQLLNECRAQLHTRTLQASAHNSKNHLSEVELEKVRSRLQKRIEELDPLPELLKQAEVEKEKLQQDIDELRKRLPLQSNFLAQSPGTDQTRQTRFSPNDDIRALQRRIVSLEEENQKLSKMLNAKDEELRNAQIRLNAKSYETTPLNKPNDLRRPDFKVRDDTYGSKNNFLQKDTFDLEQQTSRLHLEHAQLKRERDELERHFTSQMNELREKLEQSNNANRSMQNYINSLKTTYATLFNDTVPTSLTRFTTT
ncbi:unnamed protein product [Rotaria socialis]|uniref:Uncharacterized protein n=1 Tax=Rotaria socialis TaxID=392032 RepID=A0A817UGN2_9BILA|nr:unnamed protein product [Rotaria socialis]CAF3331240.1 unnamed protein product [Rotaria socialis]CAF3331599.1 unnamed protein product [Rotaria socialis]CAF4137126.1 unnamed protein product [Rotaria socialis]CAF4413238.1 unnamed protein product [Rotaria socialis]